MWKRHNIIPTRMNFFISSAEKNWRHLRKVFLSIFTDAGNSYMEIYQTVMQILIVIDK